MQVSQELKVTFTEKEIADILLDRVKKDFPNVSSLRANFNVHTKPCDGYETSPTYILHNATIIGTMPA